MISVIVPVYNVEKYLPECIESIINQTYRDIEIILIDDGSTDNSGKICDKYASQDGRIRVIHKENGGLSDARNCGMKVANGEVISFVDSDDYLSPFFLEIMYEAMMKGNCDVVTLKSACEFWDGEDCEELNIHNKEYKAEYCSSIEATRLMFYMKILTSAQFSLYKKCAFDGIEFPYGYYYEDVATTYKAFLAGEKAGIVTANIYAYRKRNDGIIRQKFSEKKLSALKIFDEVIDDAKVKELGLLQAAKARVYPMLFSVFLQVPFENKTLRKTIWKKLNTVRWDILTDKSGIMRKKNKYAALISFLGLDVTYFLGKKIGQRGTMN